MSSGGKFDEATCPECGHGGWLVGRSTAECAKCGFAVLLEKPAQGFTIRTSRKANR